MLTADLTSRFARYFPLAALPRRTLLRHARDGQRDPLRRFSSEQRLVGRLFLWLRCRRRDVRETLDERLDVGDPAVAIELHGALEGSHECWGQAGPHLG